ncbi:MAG: AI-2E family transporter [Patescibacteria group bacterium]|nr:AI-2E family transporter [Patescibacteria group bacterium]
MSNNYLLDVSWKTIFKIVISVFCVYLIYIASNVLILVIFALIFSIIFNPVIDFIQKRKIPRLFCVIFVYLIIFGVFGFLVYSIALPLALEIDEFSQNFPEYFEKTSPFFRSLGLDIFKDFQTFTSGMELWLIKASSNVFYSLLSIFGGILSGFTIFTIAFFFSLEGRWIDKALMLLFPKRYETSIVDMWKKNQKKVTTWFGAKILCSAFVGLSVFIACLALDIDYKVSLGFLAGVSNILPIIGPIIAGIMLVFFAFLDSWMKALFILIIFVIIQQIENNILIPILSKKIIGMTPVLALISLLLGIKLGGILGGILAIPLAGILFEFLVDFLKKKKEAPAEIL